jgi:hypothetical protein
MAFEIPIPAAGPLFQSIDINPFLARPVGLGCALDVVNVTRPPGDSL